MSSITSVDLESALTGNPEALEVHLNLVARDLNIDGHLIKIHCHCLTVDGNGRVQPNRLAEFMRNAVVDYAIPRAKLSEAKARDARYNSTEAVAELVEQAKRSFTDLAKTGEGGEMLLFLLAERFLKLPQILCKMDLKTDNRMHYHGADGVYAGISPEGRLKLYWGESKVYSDVKKAIHDCLSSLSPFLIELDSEEAERERDLVLLSDKADLSNPQLTEALKKYFDKSSPMSKRVEYCGVALVGFDAEYYPKDNTKAVLEDIVAATNVALNDWMRILGNRLKAENLEHLDIQFFCIPMPSAEGFRKAFLKAMGKVE